MRIPQWLLTGMASAGFWALTTAVANADAFTLSNGGLSVTDSGGAIWLSNMDLPAAMPLTVSNCSSTVSLNCINSNGSMNYQTAQLWIAALNADNGVGYLGRDNWQLPTTQTLTAGCMSSGKDGESFGYGCTGSALGSLYRGMGLTAPSSVAGAVMDSFKGFSNLQPNLYWTRTSTDSESADKVGYFTFSFASGWRGANIGADIVNRNPAANFFYVLPMLHGDAKIPGTIYDPASNDSWLSNGNIAATDTFGLPMCSGLGSGTAAPCVNANGSMTQTSAQAFINAMNTVVIDGVVGYLGRTDWTLPPSTEPITCHYAACAADPTKDPLASLFYNLLGLSAGNSVASHYTDAIGPFSDAQPYLYWSCQAANDQGSAFGSTCSPNPQCTTASMPPCAADMEWSFNFGDGLQGTDEEADDLFVTAFSPTSVPEPSTLWLFGAGLSGFVGFAALCRRKRIIT